MSVNSTPKPSVIDRLKLYAFPALVSVLATLIWRDVTEMRSDVKMLLAQSSVDKTKIEALERDVRALENAVYSTKKIVYNDELLYSHDKLFKHEEIFDIKKYIKSKNTL
jgi:hypothetical protein